MNCDPPTIYRTKNNKNAILNNSMQQIIRPLILAKHSFSEAVKPTCGHLFPPLVNQREIQT